MSCCIILGRSFGFHGLFFLGVFASSDNSTVNPRLNGQGVFSYLSRFGRTSFNSSTFLFSSSDSLGSSILQYLKRPIRSTNLDSRSTHQHCEFRRIARLKLRVLKNAVDPGTFSSLNVPLESVCSPEDRQGRVSTV